jgi:tetratricopeptide (TPR) repeat protein
MTSTGIPRTQFGPGVDLPLPDGVGDELATRLRQVHQRVAEATSRRTPNAFELLAVHYDRAGSRDRAYGYALLVADRARKDYAFQQADEFLKIAERNADNAAQLADVRIRLAEVAEAEGRYADAMGTCEGALEHFVTQGDRRRALPLHRMRERLSGALGQPFRRTLGACLILDEEAKELGLEGEHVALLTMISLMHSRLGEMEAAERVALDCVRLAERLSAENGADEPAHLSLLADALNRLGLTCQRPEEAAEYYRRALEAYRQLEDRRGQARCHNNLGIAHTRKTEWDEAQAHFADALALSRSAGLKDMWGLAAMNLAVVHLKTGAYDQARDHYGEAFAVFAANKNAEHELYALYNLADLDRERGDMDAAAELYDVAAALASRLGQSDVEIGALGGQGLSLLRGGKLEAAYPLLQRAEERMSVRGDNGAWFQGRETAEALAVGLAAVEGRTAEALARVESACTLAETNDLYSAAWLAAEAATLLGASKVTVGSSIRARLEIYAEKIKDLRVVELSRRYEQLLAI